MTCISVRSFPQAVLMTSLKLPQSMAALFFFSYSSFYTLYVSRQIHNSVCVFRVLNAFALNQAFVEEIAFPCYIFGPQVGAVLFLVVHPYL